MKEMKTVLVVDDDSAHRTMLKTLVGGWGYHIDEADDGSVAIEAVKKRPFDLVLMDVRMLKVSGLEALASIKAFNPAIPIIIMTAYSSVETAIEALKKGAYDYLTKPLDFDKLSSAMVNLLETVAHVAPSEATVMITGESGTGKELIAGAIHFNSPRKSGPFVKLNCAAITETLLESELFGHEKGAFTGADRRREGRFLQANGGSLFLDEVSEMSLTMQVKLLRVLQEREVTRVGGDQVVNVDTRVIAATNKNLIESISSGLFREDLYYRLDVVGLELPPLRKRRDDIPLLAQHFLDMFAKKNHKEIKGFTPRAMDLLIRYDWPGNVRELMNAIERCVVLARSEYIDSENLNTIQNLSQPDSKPLPFDEEKDNSMSLEDVEKTVILRMLEHVSGNKSEAARRLGITRKTLHKKLKKYGVMP